MLLLIIQREQKLLHYTVNPKLLDASVEENSEPEEFMLYGLVKFFLSEHIVDQRNLRE